MNKSVIKSNAKILPIYKKNQKHLIGNLYTINKSGL